MLLSYFVEHITYFIVNNKFISFMIVSVFLLTAILYTVTNKKYANSVKRLNQIMKFIYEVCKLPCLMLTSIYSLYYGIIVSAEYIPEIYQFTFYHKYYLTILECIVYFWLILNILNIGKSRILNWLLSKKYYTTYNVFSAISSSLQAALILLMINALIPQITLTGISFDFLENISKVLFISLIGLIFVKIIDVVSKIIESQYILHDSETMSARKINTQLAIIKRLAISIAIVITIASILRVFDGFKNIGTGILTTAGLLSAIGAFASQQSLSRIFAGLHIAFTQPIKIGDTVIVENEFGQVEEITLSYIVIKLWDLRRLILPTDYFTSKGLQNLTRSSTELLGTVFIYADYTLPVEIVRQKFFDFLNQSELWDKQVGTFQVTDIKENSMEIRALVSAVDSGTLWNLRCQIREQLIEYIVKNHPHCLSKSRSTK